MTALTQEPDLTADRAYRDAYAQNGYVVVRGLFSPDEIAAYRDHFMALRARGAYPLDMAGSDIGSDDPLKRYPRMIHMHRWDETSLRWLLDARLNHYLTQFLGVEPIAVQTMLYFKPPGARGQALHQDNFYLQVRPGTCMAAWLALDACDAANGCMQVVPGSHTWPILCPEAADARLSFTDVTIPLPPNAAPTPVPMVAGDVLFFNGSLAHGSFPNTTSDRFRRALIGHYIDSRAEQLTLFDQPALQMDGSPVEIAASPGGGPCGVWSAENGAGEPRVTMREAALSSGAGHE